MLLEAWSGLPRPCGVAEGPQAGRWALFVFTEVAVGVRRRQNSSIPPHAPNLIKSVSATFLLGTDFTAEFTSLRLLRLRWECQHLVSPLSNQGGSLIRKGQPDR